MQTIISNSMILRLIATTLVLAGSLAAQEPPPARTLQHVFGAVGMPRGFTARLIVANLGASVPDAPDCQANLQLVGIAPTRTGAETKAILKPGEKVVLEIDADKVIPARTAFNGRIEIGALVTVSAANEVAPCYCPPSLQIINNATGVTTNSVVKLETFLPAVQ